jgi:hemerythrin superfamily protein
MARMDITELLRNEHREAEAAFALFEQTDDDNVRTGLARTLVEALSVHAGAEELVLYPVIRRKVIDGAALIDHSLEEHQTVKELLVSLDRAARNGGADLGMLVGRLKTAVLEHVEEEEGKVFPRLRESVDREELRDLGRQLMEAEQHAPTHPHPHAPNRPPANKVADMAAFVLDKARDLARR